MSQQTKEMNRGEYYPCFECEKTYMRRSSLKRHLNMKHMNRPLCASIVNKNINEEKLQTDMAISSNNNNHLSDVNDNSNKSIEEEEEIKLSFKVQFFPEMDTMLLQVFNRLCFGKESQKFIMEHYLSKYKWSEINMSKLEAKFAYVTPKNQKEFKLVELKNIKPQGDHWYQENIIEPIYKEMSVIENAGNVVFYMCYIKGFSSTPPYLEEIIDQHRVQINNRLYVMDENCELTFVEEVEEDTPGFRY